MLSSTGHPSPSPSASTAAHEQSLEGASTSAHPPSYKPDPTLVSEQQQQHVSAKGGLSASAAAGSSQQSGAVLRRRLKDSLRQFPDFPSKGVLFEDILPIFADPGLHADLIQALELHIESSYGQQKPDIIVGLDARGFLFGPSLALRLGAGFVPVRKQGKLPGECETAAFQKEYGQDYFQLQRGSIKPGQRVLVVDDIIATGGSAAAAGKLVEQAGGSLMGYVFLLELDFLKGRDKLGAPVYTLLSSQESKS